MQAPFPWFGGKSRVADLVWDRFGNVANYVEPFAGSLAVLLERPHPARIETVNDKDAYLVNFWRSVKWAPEETAEFADWPVSEADLLARHRWLLATAAERIERCKTDPDFYDTKVAGWWVWGLCSWIGHGWCSMRPDGSPPSQIPHLGSAGQGMNRKLPHLGDAGKGINRKLPHLGDAGQGINRDAGGDRLARVTGYFQELCARLRSVRICCGDWDRVLGESVTVKHGVTGVFLDPPYSDGEHTVQYAAHTTDVAAAAREWAVANGDNPELRIALCGYEGEHAMPESWDCVKWKARGGYGSQGDGRGRENAGRERIWFSPGCLSAAPLFAELSRCDDELDELGALAASGHPDIHGIVRGISDWAAEKLMIEKERE